MKKTLVIAEKPSVGKDIARVLNAEIKGKGHAEGQSFVITWALGHLIELAEPSFYNKEWQRWALENLPMIPERMKLRVIKNTRGQFNLIRKLLQRDDIGEVIVATDAGREGELVARWILILSGWRGPVKRLWISSVTDTAIKEGFRDLRPSRKYDSLFYAARARAEADWLIGLNVTRALTCKYNSPLNAGRVQTPTLSILLRREKERAEFVPKDFWTIEANTGALFWQMRQPTRIFDESEVGKITDSLNEGKGKVLTVEQKEKTKPHPLLYDLTELQREANKRFGFSAKHTLSLAQSLYERHKVLTYPRTDSRYLTSDMQTTLLPRIESLRFGKYDSIVGDIMTHGIKVGKRVVNDKKVTDHHAIIPTGERFDFEKLTLDEKKLFDLVARRFLAVFFPDKSYISTQAVLEISGRKLYAQGIELKDAGWTKVDMETETDEDARFQNLSQLKQGEELTIEKVSYKKGQTEPPPRYTEATLLGAMENPMRFVKDPELKKTIKNAGLGTPATRAEIIEKLIRNYYVEREGKNLVPTSKAESLLEVVPEELASPALTAKWEKRLARIERGRERAGKFLDDIKENTARIVKDIKESDREYTPRAVPGMKCEVCGGPVMEVQDGRYRKYVCLDRQCGFEKYPDRPGQRDRKKGRKEKSMEKQMMNKFSDNADASTNLGELLKKALEEKKKK